MAEAESASNLEPCPDCGEEVSPNAPTCPNCGAPIAQKETTGQASPAPEIEEPPETRWGAGILGGVLILIFASFNLSYLGGQDTATWATVGTLLAGVIGGYWVSKGGYKAWPRVWLSLSLLSFLVPISAGIALGTGAFETQGGAEAVGAGLGVIAIGFFAFIAGTILAIIAYFTNKSANEKQKKLEEGRTQ